MPETASWFHAHQDTIGRSSGRTATGIAAYVTGQRMKDEETGRWLKRNHPGDVLAFGTVAPEGSPDYLTDNDQLMRAWNDAQRADSRKNAQLARHWNIALSRDLTPDQQAEVMAAIAQQFTDRYGTMTTWAVHSPTGHGDARNAHGHIVHNMRMVTPDGFGPKVLEPVVFKTAKREMEWARGMIADTINQGLEKAGLDERVSHLSYDARGIDREAKRHLGDKQNQAELKGERTPTGDHNRAVDERNKRHEAEQGARQVEQAQLTAEIIDLQEERRRRNRGMEPARADDEAARKQHEEELRRLMQAEQAHREQQQKQHSTSQLIEDSKRQAEAAEAEKAKRQKETEARRETGEPADARSRYADALGEHYDIRDPFGSLARAAMSEYQTFTRQQVELREQIGKARDPEVKRMLELRRQIEAHDYMAITHGRLAGISRAITQGDNAIAQRDDEEASRHRVRSMELRAERDGRGAEQVKQPQPQQTQTAKTEADTQRAGDLREPGQATQRAASERPAPEKAARQEPAPERPLHPKDRLEPFRWGEDARATPPVRNNQGTVNPRHNESGAAPRDREVRLRAAPDPPAAFAKSWYADKGPDKGADDQRTRQHETDRRQEQETKDRAGLRPDQPIETDAAPTREGRETAQQPEMKKSWYAAPTRQSDKPRGEGRDGGKPTGRGGR